MFSRHHADDPSALLTSCGEGPLHGLEQSKSSRQSVNHCGSFAVWLHIWWLQYPVVAKDFFLDSAHFLTRLTPTAAIQNFTSVNQSPLRISTASIRHNDAASCHDAVSSKIHMSAIWSISAGKSVLSDHHQDGRVRAHPDKAIVHADGRRETHAVDSSPVQGTAK
jgi:hypothetical protein